MLKRHYLGYANHPLSHFSLTKVILISKHLMAMNVSLLTSHLKLSRYQYTMQRGHPDLYLMRKCLELQPGFCNTLHSSALKVLCLCGMWLTLCFAPIPATFFGLKHNRASAPLQMDLQFTSSSLFVCFLLFSHWWAGNSYVLRSVVQVGFKI